MYRGAYYPGRHTGRLGYPPGRHLQSKEALWEAFTVKRGSLGGIKNLGYLPGRHKEPRISTWVYQGSYTNRVYQGGYTYQGVQGRLLYPPGCTREATLRIVSPVPQCGRSLCAVSFLFFSAERSLCADSVLPLMNEERQCCADSVPPLMNVEIHNDAQTVSLRS